VCLKVGYVGYSPQMAYQWNDDGLILFNFEVPECHFDTHTHIFGASTRVSRWGTKKNAMAKCRFILPAKTKNTPYILRKQFLRQTNRLYIIYYILSFMHDILYIYTYTYTYRHTYTYTYAYIQGLCVYIYIICAMY
jgi:hypothetical protein